MKNIALILFSVLLGVMGQMCLKRGMLQVGVISLNPTLALPLLLKALATPLVILGFASYAVSSMGWLIILSRVDLSYAYPLISVGYIFVLMLSWMVFKENVGLLRLLGTIVICLGVYLISRS